MESKGGLFLSEIVLDGKQRDMISRNDNFQFIHDVLTSSLLRRLAQGVLSSRSLAIECVVFWRVGNSASC